MMTTRMVLLAKWLCWVPASLALMACSKSVIKPSPPSFDTLMSKAEAELVSTGDDAALSSFQTAAATDPSRIQPWLRMARIQFDRGRYAEASQAAEQVLQRQPEEALSSEILALAGLRMAATSLQHWQQTAPSPALPIDLRAELDSLAMTVQALQANADAQLAPAPPRLRPAKRKSRRPSVPAAAVAASPAAVVVPADPFRSIRGD